MTGLLSKSSDFPQNAQARSGDRVLIIVTGHADRRPVEDRAWAIYVLKRAS